MGRSEDHRIHINGILDKKKLLCDMRHRRLVKCHNYIVSGVFKCGPRPTEGVRVEVEDVLDNKVARLKVGHESNNYLTVNQATAVHLAEFFATLADTLEV